MKVNKTALYVHWPFCKSRCTYCDFRAFPYQEKRIAGYADALMREIALWGERLNHPEITTMYFGGGTPSYIPLPVLGQTVEQIHKAFRVPEGIEFTLEANPEDVDENFARRLPEMGINRVSMGVQTFSDDVLRSIGRLHSGEQAMDAVRTLQSAGIHNVTVDLMTGLPGQTRGSIERDFSIIDQLSIPHLSIYSLTLAEHTRMHRSFVEHPEDFPSEEEERELSHLATEFAQKIGLDQYEISNYAKPKRRSRHNLTYWHLENYLGVGLSAASLLQETHYTNTLSLQQYLEKVRTAQLPIAETERLTPEQFLTELLLSGLRLNDGIAYDQVHKRTGVDLPTAKREAIHRHQSGGLLQMNPEKLVLTPKGRDLLDTVLVDLI